MAYLFAYIPLFLDGQGWEEVEYPPDQFADPKLGQPTVFSDHDHRLGHAGGDLLWDAAKDEPVEQSFF